MPNRNLSANSSRARFKTIVATLDEKVVKFDVDFQSVIGEGGYGQVLACHGTRNQNWKAAVKVVPRKTLSPAEYGNIKQEILFLRWIKHVNIVTYFGFGKDIENIYIFTERLKTDMLQEILNSPNRRFDERRTRFLLKQICLAVAYLHDQDIVHCDLKPENVLLDSTFEENPIPAVKLCDLGFARIINKVKLRTSLKGTYPYMPPEVLGGHDHNRSMDVWSTGIICFVSLTGSFPFKGKEKDDVIRDQQKKFQDDRLLYRDILFDGVGGDAIDLMKSILVENYIRKSIKEILGHRWFHDYNLFVDTRNLEKRLHKRYINTKQDSKYWKKWYNDYRERKTPKS